MTLSLRNNHPWDVGADQAKDIQSNLAPLVIESSLVEPVRSVAGIDVSFPRPDVARAAIAVLSFPDLNPLLQVTRERPASFPYIPGLLSFREIPVVLDALRGLEYVPDVLICDAQGRAHPRRLGLACHLGVLLDHPTIGCAKSRLIGTYDMPDDRRGSHTRLLDGSELIGAVVRTRTSVRPVFVSVGHRVDLRDAVSMILACASRYRLPEPTRLAHHVAAGTRVIAESLDE